jgi:5-methylthioadenosine/S-adenosylhomocysteine deaminase
LTGSLEVSKKADMAVVDLGAPHIMPHFHLSDDNLYSQLVYTGKSSDVCHVLVNGRFLMRDRQLLTVDETEVIAQAQRIARKVNTFMAKREEDLLDKMVAIGELEEREIYEVQVKAEVDEKTIGAALHQPPIEIVRRSEYEQYDTYFLFADRSKGHLRYREDIPVGQGVEVKPGYRLTLMGPTKEREYADSVILRRLRFRSAADRSLRFYREYFQPDEIKEITKHRRRLHIMYKGVRFEINLDRLLEPKHDKVLLEIKSRTWSSSDAERKAQLLTELLDVLGVNRERLVKREYVDF